MTHEPTPDSTLIAGYERPYRMGEIYEMMLGDPVATVLTAHLLNHSGVASVDPTTW